MKKLTPILFIVLALLMQVRVAYACQATGLWPSEHCQSHGSLIAVEHPDAPSDRGDHCDVSLELAVRAGRACAQHHEVSHRRTSSVTVGTSEGLDDAVKILRRG